MKSREWHNARVWLQWHPSNIMRPRVSCDAWEGTDDVVSGWVAITLSDGNCDPVIGVEVHFKGILARLILRLRIWRATR